MQVLLLQYVALCCLTPSVTSSGLLATTVHYTLHKKGSAILLMHVHVVPTKHDNFSYHISANRAKSVGVEHKTMLIGLIPNG